MASSVIYQQKRALIIGINDYPRDPLKNCINDAKDLETALESIDFIVSLALNCNFAKLYSVIDKFADTIQHNDLVLIYFAGHGKQSKDKNYLLPSCYDFDHRGSGHDYIINNAVNIEYIMNKIDSKKCRIAIYLLDFCRTMIRTQATGANQGLSAISGSSQTQALIVFACGPGSAVQDETRNKRNSSFIENLLKHITKPNKDIEEIMRDVAKGVKSQTGGFQLPHRSSSISGKVFLVLNNDQETTNQVKVDFRCELHPTKKKSQPTAKLVYRKDNILGNSIHSPEYPSDVCTTDDESDDNSHSEFLPSITSSKRPVSKEKTLPGCSAPLQIIGKSPRGKAIDESHGQRPLLVNDCDRITRTPMSNESLTSTLRQSNETCRTQIHNLQNKDYSKSCNTEEYDYDSVASSSSENSDGNVSDGDIPQTHRKSFLKGGDNSASVSHVMQSVDCDSQNNSGLTAKENLLQYSRATPIDTRHETGDLLTSSENTKPSVIRIRTLFQQHRVKISNNTTMKGLIDIIWCQTRFDMEQYTEHSHILLLFNHRLHLFVESDPNALVNDFLLLSSLSRSSTSDAIDFYVYGIPWQHAPFMYKFDNDYISLFGNPDSWCPSNFIDYKQSERSQSILLSSLYSLRLYFRPETRELIANQLAMEAQFFLALRKYLFPPAILALKHAINGFMFWFEKALLVDALIQLLTRLCNPERINPTEICDFIPLLICWLLEKCDPTEEKEDYFREVKLANTQEHQHSYFQNPVTTSKNKRQALLLEEFEDASDCSDLQYHVDIRSLTLHLSRLTKIPFNVPCTCDDYVIYDPVSQDLSVLESLEYWTDIDITELYKTIAQTHNYRSFCIITRGAVTAHAKNQLVLLEKDRTVAILLSPKNRIRPDGRTTRDIDHFFQIFDPLKCTKDTSYLVLTSDTFLDEKQLPYPCFPPYFNAGLDITKTNVDSSLKDNITVPAYQVTVILLDRSRSMSDYRIVSTNKTENCSHIDICKIMLGRLSDNILSEDEVYASGLIEYATNYKTVCPITRNREQFDKALSFDDSSGNWTCMYDAIREAIRQIKTFTDSSLRARKDCQKLIICLSDGINNSGQTTIQDLHNLIRKNGIVIDFISFIRDDQLGKKEEIDKVRQFRELCIDARGYIYKDLHVLSNIELASIFEQEAAVWLSKRSRTSCGIIDKPERYIPPTFNKTAIHQPSLNNNIKGSRRISNEFQAMSRYPSEDVIVFCVLDNITFWKVIMRGPENTPYRGKFWILYVEFDSNYPNCPPNVRFATPIYHVNISGDGKICHQILGQSWCVQTKMSTVFENILDLLKKPNFDDAMSLEKAHLYRENPDNYTRQAEAHSNKYGEKDVKKLKRQHQLEDDND